MDYEYKDQQFSVEIAEVLIPERWSVGTGITVLKKRVLSSHTQRGGLEPPEGENSRVMIKKALQNLCSIAKASEISPNVWRYGIDHLWIFGQGKHWVYLYYFPNDKSDAGDKGQSVWKCKIGKADGVDKNGKIVYDAPDRRVRNQTRGYHTKPVIALLLKTDLHGALEKVIHGILTLQDKALPLVQGKEWFLTSPSEVVKIVAESHSASLAPVKYWSTEFDLFKSD